MDRWSVTEPTGLNIQWETKTKSGVRHIKLIKQAMCLNQIISYAHDIISVKNMLLAWYILSVKQMLFKQDNKLCPRHNKH